MSWSLYLGLVGVLMLGTVVKAADPIVPSAIDSKADGLTVYKTVCFQCHGVRGEGNEALKAPSIAGKPSWYVIQQLGNFREGRRGHRPEDIPGALMAGIARLLQPTHIKKVAATIEKMPLVTPVSTTALKQPDLAEGQLLYSERCMECHRFNGTGELTFGSPPLIGLQDWYLLAQIEKFKNGWRGTHPKDAYGAKMVTSAQFIETEQARHDVVAFILSLNPEPQSETDADAFFRQGSASVSPKADTSKTQGAGGAR